MLTLRDRLEQIAEADVDRRCRFTRVANVRRHHEVATVLHPQPAAVRGVQTSIAVEYSARIHEGGRNQLRLTSREPELRGAPAKLMIHECQTLSNEPILWPTSQRAPATKAIIVLERALNYG